MLLARVTTILRLGFPGNSTFYCEVREKTNKMQQLDVYYQHFLNTFRASLCPSSGDQDVCYTSQPTSFPRTINLTDTHFTDEERKLLGPVED